MQQSKQYLFGAYLFLFAGVLLSAQSPTLDFEHYKIGEEFDPLSILEGNERYLLITGQAPLYTFDLDTKLIDTCLIREGFRPNIYMFGSARSHDVVFATSSSGLFKSIDGGKSFFLSEPDSDVSCLSSNARRYVAASRARGQTEVYDATTDGWRVLGFKHDEWPGSIDINNHGDVAICFYNGDYIYVYDASSEVDRSIATSGWVSQIKIFDDRRMLITDNTPIDRGSITKLSTDFGYTWTKVDSSSYTISAFDCNESGTCIAVGKSDTIRVSVDFGATWTTYDTDFGITRLSDVAWVRDSLFAAVGTNNLLLITVSNRTTGVLERTIRLCSDGHYTLDCFTPYEGNSTTSIFSLDGTLAASTLGHPSSSIDVSQLPSGLYYVSHICGQRARHEALVITR